MLSDRTLQRLKALCGAYYPHVQRLQNYYKRWWLLPSGSVWRSFHVRLVYANCIRSWVRALVEVGNPHQLSISKKFCGESMSREASIYSETTKALLVIMLQYWVVCNLFHTNWSTVGSDADWMFAMIPTSLCGYSQMYLSNTIRNIQWGW